MDAPLISYTYTPFRIRTLAGECRTIYERSVVAAYVDGTVRNFNGQDGSLRWTRKIGAPIRSTPVVYRQKGPDATLIVMSQPSGNLHAFDLLTGKDRWQRSGPERADGHLALSRDTLAFGSCAAAIHALPATGDKAVSSISLGEGAEVAGGVALYEGRAYTGNRGGSIVAVDLSSRTNLWVNNEWTGELFTTPAVDGKHLVVANGYGSIVCLDIETGDTRWTHEAEATDARSPVIAGDAVIASIDGTLVIMNLSDGKERWRYEISDEITSPAIVNGMILVGTDEGQVLAFGEKGRK
jgi:outer membrane protein assembly factor BamB